VGYINSARAWAYLPATVLSDTYPTPPCPLGCYVDSWTLGPRRKGFGYEQGYGPWAMAGVLFETRFRGLMQFDDASRSNRHFLSSLRGMSLGLDSFMARWCGGNTCTSNPDYCSCTASSRADRIRCTLLSYYWLSLLAVPSKLNHRHGMV
jgi:hypothetical protein